MLFLSHRDINNKLREADVLASQGKTIDEISRGMGITSQRITAGVRIMAE
jgi:hypothetical protein